MTELIDVGAASELKQGAMQAVAAKGRDLLVVRVGDSYLAAERRCPHLGGDLAAGRLEGTVVTCPRHGSRFDLRDGHVLGWTDWTGAKAALARLVKPPRPLRTYPVRVVEGRVVVEVSG